MAPQVDFSFSIDEIIITLILGFFLIGGNSDNDDFMRSNNGDLIIVEDVVAPLFVANLGKDIAENGAVVPVGIVTTLKAEQMAILVEKNPSALAAQFFIPAGTETFVTTRIKMGQTSNVYALVKADGKWSMAVKEVKVTLGGCGG